jgi:hypothetical protein
MAGQVWELGLVWFTERISITSPTCPGRKTCKSKPDDASRSVSMGPGQSGEVLHREPVRFPARSDSGAGARRSLPTAVAPPCQESFLNLTQ